MSHTTHVLIAVQPRLLRDTLAAVVAATGVGDISTFALEDDVLDLRERHFDAAVVAGVLPPKITADVVIELPDAFGNTGVGRVTSGHDSAPVTIDAFSSILALLDRHLGQVELRMPPAGIAPGPQRRVDQPTEG